MEPGHRVRGLDPVLTRPGNLILWRIRSDWLVGSTPLSGGGGINGIEMNGIVEVWGV